MVKGDLIIPQSDRIMTRSRARSSKYSGLAALVTAPQWAPNWPSDPDQFTIIPAPLKIIKVLVEELLSASGVARPMDPATGAELDEEESDDGEWEDDTDTLDLGLGVTKQGRTPSPLTISTRMR